MSDKLHDQTIRLLFDDIKVELVELKKIALNTNGRVKSLEIWRARIAGALAIISIVLIPIVGQWVTKVAQAYFK
jgi:hypothetical protein